MILKKSKNKLFSKTTNLTNIFIPLLFIFTFLLVFVNKTDSIIISKIKSLGDDFITPISLTISYPMKKTSDIINNINNFKYLLEENQNLKEENNRLQKWKTLSIVLLDENEAYKKLLSVDNSKLELKHTVRVLTKSPNVFANSVKLNAGENKEIEANSSIINHRGLVGRIIHVGKFTSTALLINDLNSNIPVKVLNHDINAIVSGHSNNQLMQIKFVKENMNLRAGHILVTSGSAGIFPRNIMVGKVYKIIDEKIYVKPFVDFKNLEFVQVVTQKK